MVKSLFRKAISKKASKKATSKATTSKFKKLSTKLSKRRTMKQNQALIKAQKASARARKKKGGLLDDLSKSRGIAKTDMTVARLEKKIARANRKTNKRAAAQFTAANKRLIEAELRFRGANVSIAQRNKTIKQLTSIGMAYATRNKIK
jgi:hypothetical protein